MNEADRLRRFRDALLAQDSPSPTRALAHQETLFAKVRRRMRIEKVVLGAVYVAVFLAAFFCFLIAGRVRDAAQATWWAVCSMHLLLWFQVFFLSYVGSLISRILPPADQVERAGRENRKVFIWALAACALGTGFLVRAAFVDDPLRVAQSARYILWCAAFHLFWYPFAIATSGARLWLKFKEMELKTPGREAVGSPPPAKESSAGGTETGHTSS